MNNIECVEVVQQIPLVITTVDSGSGGGTISTAELDRIAANQEVVTIDKEILRDPLDGMLGLPPKTLLSHIYKGIRYNFIIGQMIRYLCNSGDDRVYFYYILEDITDEGAIWRAF